ncbi:NAD-dependent epimerase/dehydratase family protein [Nonomuraea sp. KC401]|uniref:NmrA family NAD(P)-binding protein n=1 Tax=unclassified Nonomuraea TaxID=2593643 RepID=UPI0010FE5058|nr:MULTISPECIES: NmrA family NAD(P)-binding protein [unclassified Nonomuraea]NBE98831.1 NmrA family NAD(P)-binding protein [Nonomuraea sp. K271]TLF65075.1 NAD-dependent epimerase/dehydratase family protein [Nonomuraea sp. KC401]
MGKILVTGATGNVGRHVVTRLAKAGLEVRALARDPVRAQLPVETVRGDLTDPESLEPALDGVESVFLLWPTTSAESAARTITAIAKHARRVVYLSADAEDAADDEEPSYFHHGVERRIRHSGVGWTFLRPGGFAANTLMWAAQIRQGVVRWPFGQAVRALIHERDIAAVAVHVLTSAGHNGATYALTGPEQLTQAEQVRIIGEVLGREVRWEELPVEQAREQLLAAWGDPSFVDLALQGWERFVTRPERVTGTVERLLGRPALTFRQWAEDRAADFS